LLNKERWHYAFPEDVTPSFLMKLVQKEYGLDIFSEIAERDILEMVKICRVNNVKAVICSYPMGTEDKIAKAHEVIAKEFNIPFVNNEAIFKNLPNVNEYLSPDRWHPNEKGYKLVAENIYSCIKDEISEK